MSRAIAEEALEEVRRIVTERLKGRDAMVVLFGSRASGSTRVASDIDVAVLPRSPLPTGLLSRIREALEESHVPYRVDVVDLSSVDPAFRKRVLETGVIWAG
jgi:predicted nucleotidyltransferase